MSNYPHRDFRGYCILKTSTSCYGGKGNQLETRKNYWKFEISIKKMFKFNEGAK